MESFRPSVSDTVILSVGLAAALAAPLDGQATGEELFSSTCAACHTLGTEPLVGPGLAGVEEDRDRDWLVSFIMEPDRMIADGDSLANRLLAEYEVPMPNFGLTRAQAESVLDYIASASSETGAAAETDTSARAPATEEQVLLGRALFQGKARFANRGPTCNSCHHVTREGVLGGGSLAVDLSEAYSRLGGGGIEAMVRNPPFPVMRRAYAERPLSDEEVGALVAFLHRLDVEPATGKSPAYGVLLAGAGILGSLLLGGLFTVAWRGRRRGSVNQEIFGRQIETR